jgi:hypothetical protein
MPTGLQGTDNPLQKTLFFSFFCNLFCKILIFKIIRVAEGVAEGLQRKGGYIVRPLSTTASVIVLQPFCNRFCNLYCIEQNIVTKKVAEKREKNKVLRLYLLPEINIEGYRYAYDYAGVDNVPVIPACTGDGFLVGGGGAED